MFLHYLNSNVGSKASTAGNVSFNRLEATVASEARVIWLTASVLTSTA